MIAHEHPAPDTEPVVWIHGYTGSVHFWEAAMYPELTTRRSWYSISLPLHYPSTYDYADFSGALDENLLAELIDKAIADFLPPGGFHLVGYSVGGLAALNYAAKYPQRVLSVVSVGGFMAGRTRGLEGALEWIAKGNTLRKGLFYAGYWLLQRHRIFYKMATVSYARRWLQLLSYPALDATIDLVFQDVRHHPIAGQRAWARFLLTINLLDEVCTIACPVLVVAGDRDPVIPYNHQQQYAAMLPNARLVTLPGTGHVPFAEAPATFKKELIDWLCGSWKKFAGERSVRND